jgi:hypothetical protein
MAAMELSEFHKEALENVTETETTTIINLRLEMKADELREATLFEAEVAVLAREADLVLAELHAEHLKRDRGSASDMCPRANQRIAHADEAAAKARVSLLSAELRALGLRRNCA